MYDPFRILELDQMLRKAREEQEARNDPTIRARIAAVQTQEEQEKKMILARTAKIKSYLEFGYTRQDISQMLGIHPYIVDTEAALIEREDSEMDRIRLGWKRGGSGYFSIHNGLPTRRLHRDKQGYEFIHTLEVEHDDSGGKRYLIHRDSIQRM